MFLFEAQAAKIYWQGVKIILSGKINNFKRLPKNKDLYNKLLNIGYHYLANEINKILAENFEYPELGLLHKSPEQKALVYDFMELYRQPIVDKAFLRFINKKKKDLTNLNNRDISYFISLCKDNLNKKYYLKNLGYCLKLKNIIIFDINKFKQSIKINSVWRPIKLLSRHKMRCKQKTAT